MFRCVIADVITNLVVQVVHEPAFLNGEYLVESACDVETDGWHVLQTLTLVLGKSADLFFGQIALVGTSVVQFVTVFLRFDAAQYGAEFRQLHFANAMQLVEHLLLFELQLLFIGKVLPFATTAHAKVLTKGYCTDVAFFDESHNLAFGKGVLLTANLNVAYVAWNTKRYEHHQVVPVEQTLAFGGYSLNGDTF